MATVQRASMIQYPDGQVVIHNIRKKRVSIPVFGANESYSATLVNTWYDGTAMDDSKADGSIYFKLKALPSGADSSLEQYVGSFFKLNLPKDGELFLEKDAMQEMRDLNPTEILLLQMGYYKGVRLNGYYEKGDAPAPIDYFMSNTTDSDDGGSVIEVGDIKLEHDFNDVIYPINFGAVGDGSNETTPLQNMLRVSDNKTIIFQKSVGEAYYANQLSLTDRVNVTIDFNGQRINYNSLDGRRQFYAENPRNIKMSNGNLIGRMFEGLSKESVSSVVPDSSQLNRNNTHRLITVIGGTGVVLENLVFSNFHTGIDFRNSSNVTLIDIEGYDLNTGVMFTNSWGHIRRVTLSDCRYEFSEVYSPYGLTVTSAQGSGMILQIPEEQTVKVEDCTINRCWTNGYRVQGDGGNVIFTNCRAVQSGRHGFSSYGKLKSYVATGCRVEDLADPLFWDGSATQRTYQIPVRTTYPVGYSFSYPMEEISLINCSFYSPLYQGEIAPVRTDEVNGHIMATVPYSIINTTVVSSEEGNHGEVNVRGCNFKGFINRASDSVILRNVRGGLNVDNVTITTKYGEDSNYPFTDKYNLSVSADNVKISKVISVGGSRGVTVEADSVTSRYLNVNSCEISNCNSHGLRTVSSPAVVPVVSGNVCRDINGIYYQPYDSLLQGNSAVETRSGVTSGVALQVLTVDLPKENTANSINTTAIVGPITKIGPTSSITGRQAITVRPKLTGNNNNPAGEDIITFNDFLNTIAGVGRSGVVRKIPASADTATPASGETPTKAEFDALLAELRDLKTKMRQGVAPILTS